jgi:Eco57I restriction-modification methylase
MAKGIPDAAWDPIEGDDKKTASALKKRNKKAAEGQRSLDTLWSKPVDTEVQTVMRAVAELDAASDVKLEELTKKEERWDGILGSPEYRHQKFVADAWCAAFVWPKQPGELAEAAPTNELWRQLRDAQGKPPELTTKTVGELADQYRFFHWNLQFPQVFAKGGFNVVLGNPPWERLTLRDQEWFASRDPNVAFAKNAADRRRKIQELVTVRPELLKAFQVEKRASLGEKVFSRESGYFPLAGVGDVNTFALFAETAQRVVSPHGFTGLIVPSGVATTDTTKLFFASLVTGKKLRSLFDFDNRGGLFPAVQGNVRFCLLVTGGQKNATFRVAAQLTRTAALADPERVYELSAEDIERINPGTLTCPLFLTRRDARIVGEIYRRHPVLEKEEGSATAGWRVSLSRMLHMGDDADDFRTEEQLRAEGAKFSNERWLHPTNGPYLPLYESKLCDQYNHRAATFDGIPLEDRFGTHPATRSIPSASLMDPAVMPVPRYWAPESRATQWAESRRLLLAFRNAVSATADARSLNACLMPVYPSGDSLKFICSNSEEDLAILLALLNSFLVDFVFRQKATGANASFFLIRQLPVLAKDSMEVRCPWNPLETVRDWITARVRELSCASDDMRIPSLSGSTFVFNEHRRVLLRAEIDAAILCLYGVSREDASYMLDSFPVFRRAEVTAHGEYRTKRVILEIFDAMAEAARTGKPYQTRLDPPPADPRVAHPARDRGNVLPFPAPTRPVPQQTAIPRRALPEWGPELLPAVATRTGVNATAGKWGTTLTGFDLGIAALAAVLRNLPGPASRDEVERAVVLAMLPSLLQSKFDAKAGATWRRVIGAANMRLMSVAGLAVPWGEVLRRAAIEHVLHVDADGRWSAGADVQDAPWAELDARALVSLSWLASVDASAEDNDLMTQLEVLRAA